jgi:flagellar hook-basal body complex protein FliE
MDIKTNSLFAQMQAMSVEAGSNRSAEIPAVNTSSSNFGDMLKDAVSKVNEIQLESGDMKKRFELGDNSVTLAETMIASQKAGVAFDATVQIRNKFVEAYKEIMSMPV